MRLFAWRHLVLCVAVGLAMGSSPWKWRCDSTNPDDPKCLKELEGTDASETSLERCKLTCGPSGALWPRPREVTLSNSVSYFLPTNIALFILASPDISSLLNQAFALALESIDMYNPNYVPGEDYWTGPWDSDVEDHKLIVEVSVQSLEEFLTLDTNEMYILAVDGNYTHTVVQITAQTFFGARHGMETFTQLIDFEEETNSLQMVNSVYITDSPTYSYRGLSIDTSRNFIPVEDLKRTLNAMSYSKLNTLHWHITDSHSFPLNLDNLPNMAYYGAYASSKTYSSNDVKDLILYARLRGIRILPEIDAPAHVGNGWQWGEAEGLGSLVVCFNKEPWYDYCLEPPCGQFNLANQEIYSVIDLLFEELVDIFAPIDLFHFGGNDVNFNCWNSSSEIVDWMQSEGNSLTEDGYKQEWANFQQRVRLILTQRNGGQSVPGILWTARLTEYLSNTEYILQFGESRNSSLLGDLLNQGYQLIMSNYDAWYLDCGFGNWLGEGNNWCSPFKGWKTVYDNSPLEIALESSGSDYSNLILGGEAVLATEQADASTLDSRLWPRGSALAERLWLEPSTKWEEAENRFVHNRQRLVLRGIRADRVQPEWCHQNDGGCYI